MTNSEFAAAALNVAVNYKTLYVNGTWGWPMTDRNKARCLFNSYNEKAARKTKIMAASPETFGFDCCGLIKGLIWGWTGDSSKQYGGAGYAINGLPDVNEAGLIAMCETSTDFSQIVPGALVWTRGHIGIYAGNGLAVEATPAWKDGVQITACNTDLPGFQKRTWTKWGRFPLIIYKEAPVMSYTNFKLYMQQYLQELQKLPADAYAKTALAWAQSEGLMEGSGSGNLMPQSPVKRQDLAVILQRFAEDSTD